MSIQYTTSERGFFRRFRHKFLLVHCRRAVTPVMALRLSRLFGNSADFWLNVQNSYDLWYAERNYRKQLDSVVMLKAA